MLALESTTIFWCFVGVVGGIFGLVALAIWVWGIVEVVTKEPVQDPDRHMWLALVVILVVMGTVIYYAVRRPERIRKYGR